LRAGPQNNVRLKTGPWCKKGWQPLQPAAVYSLMIAVSGQHLKTYYFPVHKGSYVKTISVTHFAAFIKAGKKMLIKSTNGGPNCNA